MRRLALTLLVILPLLPVALAARCGGGPSAACIDEISGVARHYGGRGAIDACLRDPALQTPGHPRVIRASAGHFDFGGSARFELDAGWTLEGAGAGRTFLHATLPFHNYVVGDLRSALFVKGADVVLRDFTFEGNCSLAPVPDASCAGGDPWSHVGIFVACGYDEPRVEDCDVDGLIVERVEVRSTWLAFAASGTPGLPELGIRAVHTNFLDFVWTLRDFRVSGRDEPWRYVRVFELGNPKDAFVFQGPGLGVAERRSYRLNVEDTRIDTHVGLETPRAWVEGLFTAATASPLVDFMISLRNSRLEGTFRILGLSSLAAEAEPGQRGSLGFFCEDSALVAHHADWDESVALPKFPTGCAPADAVVYLAEAEQVTSPAHDTFASFVRCQVEVVPTACTAPGVALSAGEQGASRVPVCAEDSSLVPGPPRGPIDLEQGPGPELCPTLP